MVTAFVSFIATRPASLDDAFILLVYVRHLRDGGGLYYNVGDGPIDGFTSPLDLALKTAAAALARADSISAVWCCTLFWHVAVVVAGYTLAVLVCRRASVPRGRSFLVAFCFGLFLASSSALAEGSAFLLETPLFAFLALISTGTLAMSPLTNGRLLAAASILLCALALARPEGVPLALFVGACLAHEGRRLVKVRDLSGAVILFVGCIATYYVARVLHFGYWAPNTYYAKTSVSRLNEIRDGIDYVVQYAKREHGAALLLIPLGPLASIAGRWQGAQGKEWRRRCFLTGLCAILTLGVVVYSGGDCYEGGRFLAVPILLGSLSGLLAVVGRARPFGGLALLAIAGLALFELTGIGRGRTAESIWTQIQNYIPPSESTFACDQEIAVRLQRIAGSGVVAQTAYQRLKYFADGLQVLDATGLNNREIAHSVRTDRVQWGKADFEDIVARRPEVFVLGNHVEPRATPMAQHALATVLATPELAQEYFAFGVAPRFRPLLERAYLSASIAVCGGFFNFLIRRDFAVRADLSAVIVNPR